MSRMAVLLQYGNNTKPAGEGGPAARINGFDWRLKLDANRLLDSQSPSQPFIRAAGRHFHAPWRPAGRECFIRQ